MRCFRARRWLAAYLDGELEPPRRAALEAHLARCARCTAELQISRAQWEAIGETGPVPPLSPHLWGQLLASAEEAERWPWHRRHRVRLAQAVCVTACMVVGFVSGALLSWQRPLGVAAPERGPLRERMLVVEAFEAPALGLRDGKDGLFRCVPK